MPYLRLALVLSVLLVTGCGGSQQVSAPAEPRPAPPAAPTPPAAPVEGDVLLDGVSIIGPWQAVETIGDAQATRDLEDGTLEMNLLIGPNGSAVLTGVDHREGEGPVTFRGLVTGDQLVFDGLEGAALLQLNGRRLLLRDPRGRSTAYVRASR